MLCHGDPDLDIATERPRQVMQNHVARLGGTGSPDDLEWTTIQGCRQSFSDGIECHLGARANAMWARWIPNKPIGRIQPRLPSRGQERTSGVVIEIHWEETAAHVM
jgi:hypothetical protein